MIIMVIQVEIHTKMIRLKVDTIEMKTVLSSSNTCIPTFLMASLNFRSWNATGIMSSASYVSNLLEKKALHFFGISEHWLYPQNLHFLDTIHRDYTGFGVCDNDLMSISRRKVGKGVAALLWHRALNDIVTPLDIDSDRICDVQFRFNENLFYLHFASLRSL